jgi:hypothetical protein
MSKGETIIGLIALALPLLKVNPDLQTRKNLRQYRKHYKRIRKIIKKDGITPEEQEKLDELIDVYIDGTIELIK